EQQVDPALDQCRNGFAVCGHQLVVAHVAKTRVVDVGRKRCRAIGRSQRAGDEARLGRRPGGPGIRPLAGNASCREVDITNPVLKLVVRLGDARRIEGVGLDDVRACGQEFVVKRGHDLGTGQDQQIVIAPEVMGVVEQAAAGRAAIVGLREPPGLDHGAHCPVEDQDALAQQPRELRRLVVGGGHFALALSIQKTKPVQLAAERVPVENRFSGIWMRPASCREVVPARIKSALRAKLRVTTRVVNSGAANPVPSLATRREIPMLDPDIRRLLDTVFRVSPPAGAPDVAQLRVAAEVTPRLLGGDPEPVASIGDLRLPGPSGPLAVRVYRPGSGALPLVLYAHGGGWVVGSLDSHDKLCRILANRFEAVVVAVDYRLAPEHVFPAALDDVEAAWQWVRGEARALGADGLRFALAGD